METKPWQIPYPMENWKMRYIVVWIQNHDKFIVLNNTEIYLTPFINLVLEITQLQDHISYTVYNSRNTNLAIWLVDIVLINFSAIFD
jgi:hypothetical protein